MKFKPVDLGIAASMLLFIAVCLLLVAPSGPPDPVYHGRPLSQWVLQLNAPNLIESEAAKNTLNEAGTNSLPLLLSMASAHDSKLVTFLRRTAPRPSSYIFQRTTPYSLNAAAHNAFEVLGSNAAVAIPELISIYDKAYSADSQIMVALTLADFGPVAKAAVPSLLRETTNREALVCMSSCYALGAIHENPADVIPALTRTLDSSHFIVGFSAASALGKFGLEASNAIPSMVRLMSNTFPLSRGSFAFGELGGAPLDSLREIDPAAADKLEAELRTNAMTPSASPP